MFGKKKKEPATVRCFLCGQSLEKSELNMHYDEHLIQVTDIDGQRAYTFECPRCGAMDLAWGAGSRNDHGARSTAKLAISFHLEQRHSIPMY